MFVNIYSYLLRFRYKVLHKNMKSILKKNFTSDITDITYKVIAKPRLFN